MGQDGPTNDDNSPQAHKPRTGRIVPFPVSKERRVRDRASQPDGLDNHPPLINLPPATKCLLALLVLIHVVVSLADPVTRFDIYQDFGFIAARYTSGFSAGWQAWASPLTYAFLHFNWMHLMVNGAMLMAFGAGLERLMGARRMIVFFILCSLGALIPQFLLDPQSDSVVIGASGGLSGFFAGILLMMRASGHAYGGRFGLWPFIILWIAISVIFGMTGAPDGSPIAWAAHVGGFIAGFIVLKPVMRLIP